MKEKKTKKANPESFRIPVEGSIGLLALGDVGLKAWRKARKEEIANDGKNKKQRG